ncbi:MAG: hypothetical protein ABSC94_18505 [Polyangiaceae bacterium]
MMSGSFVEPEGGSALNRSGAARADCMRYSDFFVHLPEVSLINWSRVPMLLGHSAGAVVFAMSSGCSTLSPPFDKMKDQPMTVYRLQNYEPPAPTQIPSTTGGFQLPPQIQQWIQAGASLLPPGLLPPGLLPGTAPPGPTPGADVQRFHNFRILDYQPVTDASIDHDIVDVFGHAANFETATSNCLFAEFGFAMAQPNGPTADVLVSLSCEQVAAFNITWPYARTGLTPEGSKKVASIAQRVFQGR